MEQILTFGLVCPFWASFRNPSTVNVHVTYPFPPPTTLYGLLNAARGWPQDWCPDRNDWQISLVVESRGTMMETFSKVMKAYEDKRSRQEREEKENTTKGFFDRTTLVRQKLMGVRYFVYLRASQDLLAEAQQALRNPRWPLYLGESDDVVDIASPHIVNVSPKPVQRIHSIVSGIVEGCQLFKVPIRFNELRKGNWSADYQIYSLPPVGEGIELGQTVLAYPIEGRNIVFNGRENYSGKAQLLIEPVWNRNKA